MKASSRTVAFLLFGAWFSFSVVFSACTPPSNPDGGNPDQTCTQLGCACAANKDCASGLSCTQRSCQPNTAETNPDASEPTPEKSDCIPGSATCRCTPTAACEKGLRCENGACRACPEGTAGCACKPDQTCHSGLACENNQCAGCLGKANCPCFGNGNCETGHVCALSSSGANACRVCSPPEEGCNCDKDADCGNTHICVNKRCMDPSKINTLPRSPLCYSTCESDIKAKDGTLKVCHPEYKLVEDCPAGQTCQQGSCRTTEQIKQDDPKAYPYCQTDAHCPSWQACVQGRCYSTCRATSDCPSGFRCFSYVCRRECHLRTNPCDNQSTCTTKGSDDGICLPKANPHNPNTPPKTTAGHFSIAYRNLSLTPVQPFQDILLTNQSNEDATFTLKRASDTLASAKPLAWLKIDLCKTYSNDGKSCSAFEGRPTATEPLVLPKVAPNRTLILRVSGGDGKPPQSKAYDGSIQIQTPTLGTQSFYVSYRENADGQWKGTMIAFGNFEDTHIDQFHCFFFSRSSYPQKRPSPTLAQLQTPRDHPRPVLCSPSLFA